MASVSLGLTSAEARQRLSTEGANALPSAERHGLVQLIAAVLREPMFLLTWSALPGPAPSGSSPATA